MSRKTTAGKTEFCATQVSLRHGFKLWVDGNGKITAGNGSLDDPKPNAFSLVEIQDCPGATPTCKAACYVHGLRRHAPEIHDLYRENSETIREILASKYVAACAREFGHWIGRSCRGGFRWHVSGDVFSAAYAAWIVIACKRAPKVKYWIYTRSLDYVPILAMADNLGVNISADRDNYKEARKIHPIYRARLTYLTSDGEVPHDLPKGSVIFPDYKLRGDKAWSKSLPRGYAAMICPVDMHGKAETRRCGPCDRCIDKPRGGEDV